MKSVSLALLRAQPPHTGHKKIIEELLSFETDHVVCISASGPDVIGSNLDKNPLNFAQRKQILEMYYPFLEIRKKSSMWSMLVDFGSQYDSVTVVCGSDRYKEYLKFLRYELEFGCKINIHEVKRILNEESGTFLRTCLKNVDRTSFHKYSLISYDNYKEIELENFQNCTR